MPSKLSAPCAFFVGDPKRNTHCQRESCGFSFAQHFGQERERAQRPESPQAPAEPQTTSLF